LYETIKDRHPPEGAMDISAVVRWSFGLESDVETASLSNGLSSAFDAVQLSRFLAREVRPITA
jgi:hypothetical protein